MSYYVHLLVSFQCEKNEGVAELAQKHLPLIREADEQEAISFLEELRSRTGTNPGTKGGMSLWGMVGNRTDPEKFVESLRPFWDDLLRSQIEGGPLWFNHIVVFYEFEEQNHSNALEIFLTGDFRTPLASRPLVINKHEQLPFQWR